MNRTYRGKIVESVDRWHLVHLEGPSRNPERNFMGRGLEQMNKAILIFAIALLGASNASADNQCDSGAHFLRQSRAAMHEFCTTEGGRWGKLPAGGNYCELGSVVVLTDYKSGKVDEIAVTYKVSSALEAFEIIGGCLETYGSPTKQSEDPIWFLWVRGVRHTFVTLEVTGKGKAELTVLTQDK